MTSLFRVLRVCYKIVKKHLMKPEIRDVLHRTLLSDLKWRARASSAPWKLNKQDQFWARFFSPILVCEDGTYKMTLTDHPCGDGLCCTGYCLTIRDSESNEILQQFHNNVGLGELHHTIYCRLDLLGHDPVSLANLFTKPRKE